MSLDRFRTHRSNPDYTYITLAALLVLFGLIMISSSSVVVSSEIYGKNYSFVTRQAVAIVIGLIGAVIASKIHYTYWKKYAKFMLGLSIILLLFVFIPGIGKTTNGASRWIDIGPLQFQPSELLKLSFIIYLAAWFEKKRSVITSFSEGFFPFAALLAVPAFIILLQRDMGTLSVLVFTAAVMFAVAGATPAQLGVGAVSGVAIFYMLILIAPYRLKRLTTFLNPDADTLGAGYHINQSLLAVGSGGLWGRGFGQSLQKYLYLPEPQTDSIFAIIVEELGFFRASGILLIIAFFAYRGYQIANRAGDPFGRMLAFGITSWFLFQSLINIASILGLMPLTGVPLPFISYGGTALMISLVGVGIVVNISKHSYGK